MTDPGTQAPGEQAPGTPPAAPALPPWEAAGFKEPQAIWKALEDTKRKLSELGEENSNLTRLMTTVLDPGADPGRGTPGGEPKGSKFGDLLTTDPDRAAEAIAADAEERAVRRIHGEQSRTSTITDIQQRFYTENKDLAPYPEIVRQVFTEVTLKNPKLPIEQGLPEVAARARTRLAEIRTTLLAATPTPPPIITGHPMRPEPVAAGGEPPVKPKTLGEQIQAHKAGLASSGKPA